MKRTVGARYLPLAAIVAIQLLIVAVAPSQMQNQSVSTGGDPSDFGTPGDGANDFTDPATGEPVEDTSGEVAIDAAPGDTGLSADFSEPCCIDHLFLSPGLRLLGRTRRERAPRVLAGLWCLVSLETLRCGAESGREAAPSRLYRMRNREWSVRVRCGASTELRRQSTAHEVLSASNLRF